MRIQLGSGALLFVCAAIAGPQSSTQLMVRIEPEARLNLASVSLRFRVPGPEVNTVTLEALARPLPSQQVIVTATPQSELRSGAAVIPLSAVRWQGTKTAARGGGTAAACTSGALLQASARPLAENWKAPGALTCSVSFSVDDPSRFAPGVYTTTLSFDLRMQ